ncbi:hypothetical protein V8F20_001837 [Naviculisporaceae sp. PSN 640]
MNNTHNDRPLEGGDNLNTIQSSTKSPGCKINTHNNATRSRIDGPAAHNGLSSRRLDPLSAALIRKTHRRARQRSASSQRVTSKPAAETPQISANTEVRKEFSGLLRQEESNTRHAAAVMEGEGANAPALDRDPAPKVSGPKTSKSNSGNGNTPGEKGMEGLYTAIKLVNIQLQSLNAKVDLLCDKSIVGRDMSTPVEDLTARLDNINTRLDDIDKRIDEGFEEIFVELGDVPSELYRIRDRLIGLD